MYFSTYSPLQKKVIILSCLHGKIIVYSIKFLIHCFLYTHRERHTKVVKGKFALNHFSFWSLIFQYHELVPSLWFFCLEHKGWIWYSYFRSKRSDCALKNTGKKGRRKRWGKALQIPNIKQRDYLPPPHPASDEDTESYPFSETQRININEEEGAGELMCPEGLFYSRLQVRGLTSKNLLFPCDGPER